MIRVGYTPEDAYDEIQCAVEQRPRPTVELTVERTDATEQTARAAALDLGINASYFILRRWIWRLALAMPLILWVGGAYANGWNWTLGGSISQYYHEPGGWLRDVLVGTLSAVGFFMIGYKGYSRREDVTFNIGGCAALGVAFFPMASAVDWCHHAKAKPRLLPMCDYPITNNLDFGPHLISAITVFACIAYACFALREQTLQHLEPKDQASFRMRYRSIGSALVVAIVAVLFTMALQPKGSGWPVVFLLETVGLFAFAWFWATKNRELTLIFDRIKLPPRSG